MRIVLLLTYITSQEKLDKQDMQQITQTAYSLIAETLLLDQQIQQQKVTTSYSHVYLNDLQQEVVSKQQELAALSNNDIQTDVNKQKKLLQQLTLVISHSKQSGNTFLQY